MPIDTETSGCEVMVPLNATEERDLERIESTIAANLAAFFRVAFALMEIKQRRLYRGEFKTFDDYCRKKWEMHKAYACRLIGAAEVYKYLSTMGDIRLPESERQVRALTAFKAIDSKAGYRYSRLFFEDAAFKTTIATIALKQKQRRINNKKEK